MNGVCIIISPVFSCLIDEWNTHFFHSFLHIYNRSFVNDLLRKWSGSCFLETMTANSCVYKLHLRNRDLKYSNATYAYTLYERLPLRYQRSIYYVVTWAPLYQSTASPTKVDQESIEERIWTTSRINNGISINNILSVLIPIHGSGWLMVMLCYILAFTVILLLPLVADTLATAQQNVTELNISHR